MEQNMPQLFHQKNINSDLPSPQGLANLEIKSPSFSC